jgi:alpha-tubulin suppressor-like RCC1 family protein
MACLLIDSAVAGYEQIVAAAKADVKTIVFDRYTDTFQTLKEKLSAYEGFSTLGIVQHGDMYAPYYKLLETQVTPAFVSDVESRDPTLESWAELKDFYRWLVGRGVRTIDLISCALYANPGWVYALTTLENELEIDFRASVNNTGNIASGGDWIQESDGMNISEIYFTEAIVEYVGLLYTVDYRKSSQMVCAPGATINGVAIRGSITTNANIRAESLPENMVVREPTAYEARAWGDLSWGGDNNQAIAAGSGIVALASTANAFAALKSNGTVYAWGDITYGGSNTSAQAAGSGIVALAYTFRAFAALKSDGTLRAWGDLIYGGSNASALAVGSGVVALASTSRAFAALKSDGTVHAWGDLAYGGSNASAQAAGSGIVALASTLSAFAALKSDGTLRAWGNPSNGGSNASALAAGSGIVALASTLSAFAALKSDGTVGAWGNPSNGGSNASAQAAGSGIVAIASTQAAFAALKSDGTVYAWGELAYGGSNASAQAAGSGIVALASTTRAFAALKSDGTLRAWGDLAYGGSNASALDAGSGIVALASTYYAFAALKSDGTVYAWGDINYGGSNASALAAGSGIIALASTRFAFAALKSDGTVYAWGELTWGGSNASAQAAGSGITELASTRYAFAALKPTPPPTDASSAVSTGLVGYYIATSTDTNVNVLLSMRTALFQTDLATRINAKLDYIKAMRDRLQSSMLYIQIVTPGPIPSFSINFLIFKESLLFGKENINTEKDIYQFFPTINTFNTSATLEIQNIPADNSSIVCIELPINIPTTLTENSISVKTLFFDGTNIFDGINNTGTLVPVGSTIQIGTKFINSIAVGSLVGYSFVPLLPPNPPTIVGVQTTTTFNSIVYSEDGMNWRGVDFSVFTRGNSAAWNGTMWVGVGSGSNPYSFGPIGLGVNSLAYSNDGIHWTGLGNTLFTIGNRVAWNGTLWIATGSGPFTMAYSYDGLNWTGINTSPFSTRGNGLTWNGVLWVATGSGTHTLAYSSDGIIWIGLGTTIFSTEGKCVLWGGKYFIAGGTGTANTLAYSIDGIVWTGLGTTIFDSGYYASDIAWNGSRYVAVGQGNENTIAYSDDGINWTGLGKTIFHGPGYGSSGVDIPEYGAGLSVVYNSRIFVASGSGYNILAYSADGINWRVSVNDDGSVLANGYGLATNSGLGSFVAQNQIVASNNISIVSDSYIQQPYNNTNVSINYKVL